MSIIIEILILALAVYIFRKISDLQSGIYNLWRTMEALRKELERINPGQSEAVQKKHGQTKEAPGQPATTYSVEVPPAPVNVPPVPKTSTTPPPLPQEPPRARQNRPEAYTEKHANGNMERMIGINLFSKIGIVVLITGIGFFVKYAIDKDWINETSRTVLGLATGFGLWAIAFFLRKNYRNFASILTGGGFAVCFVTVAIAYNVYELFSPITAMSVLIALTATMIAISLIFDRRGLAMAAIIGGFTAPFIAQSPDGSYIALLGYVLILDGAMFAITMKQNWWELAAVACPLTWIMAGLSCGEMTATMLLGYCVLFFLLFSLPLATVLNSNMPKPLLFTALVASILVNEFTFLGIGTSYIADISAIAGFKGLIPIIIATVNGILYFRFYAGSNEAMSKILTGLTMLFIWLIFPMQFSDAGTTAICIISYAALLNLGFAISRNKLMLYGAMLSAASAYIFLLSPFIMLYNTSGLGESLTCAIYAVPVIASAWTINRYKESYGIHASKAYTFVLWTGIVTATIGAFGTYNHYWSTATAYRALDATVMAAFIILLLATSRGGNAGWLMPGIGAFLFCTLSLPIAHTDTELAGILLWTSAILYIATSAIHCIKAIKHGDTGALSRVRYLVYFNIAMTFFAVATTEFMLRHCGLIHLYSAGLSVSLTLCGAVQLIIGLQRHIKPVRITGITIIGIAIAKLVVYDLWRLPTIGRIIVFILLGVILLLISFLYQKLRSAIFDK